MNDIPAFPTKRSYPAVSGRHGHEEYYDGMTLRDYFAAKAMAAYIIYLGPNSQDSLALEAYKAADAMLQARTPKKEEG